MAWKVWVGLPVLTVAALLNTGCFTLVKQAYSEVRGAQGDFRLISERSGPGPGAVEFRPITTTLGRLTPAAVMRAYDRCANLAAARLRGGSGEERARLIVDSELVYFQRKGLLSGAQLLVRVRLQSAGEGIIDGLVVAESNSFREGDEDALAQAAVDAISRYLAARRPVTSGERERSTSP